MQMTGLPAPVMRPAWLARLDRALVGFTAVAGGAGLAAMVVLTSWNVIVMRKILNAPILGAEDILTLNLVLVVAVAIPFGGRVGAHIEIEVLEASMPPASRAGRCSPSSSWGWRWQACSPGGSTRPARRRAPSARRRSSC